MTARAASWANSNRFCLVMEAVNASSSLWTHESGYQEEERIPKLSASSQMMSLHSWGRRASACFNFSRPSRLSSHMSSSLNAIPLARDVVGSSMTQCLDGFLRTLAQRSLLHSGNLRHWRVFRRCVGRVRGDHRVRVLKRDPCCGHHWRHGADVVA